MHDDRKWQNLLEEAANQALLLDEVRDERDTLAADCEAMTLDRDRYRALAEKIAHAESGVWGVYARRVLAGEDGEWLRRREEVRGDG